MPILILMNSLCVRLSDYQRLYAHTILREICISPTDGAYTFYSPLHLQTNLLLLSCSQCLHLHLLLQCLSRSWSLSSLTSLHSQMNLGRLRLFSLSPWIELLQHIHTPPLNILKVDLTDIVFPGACFDWTDRVVHWPLFYKVNKGFSFCVAVSTYSL